MQPGGKDLDLDTETAGPSAVGPTRTSEPSAGDMRSAHMRPPQPVNAGYSRDPERYQILGEHGRGGLGRVSRAHDCDLGRDIAIKELISRTHVSEVRFLREALITARLEHPGIVPVYEAGRWPDGTPFYAMKLVSGRSLRDLIAERTTVEARIGLLHHVIAVADAMAYAHGRNIIHRDLKPSNIVVGDFGETIVIDWGLAKDLSATEDSTLDGTPFRTNHDDGLTSTGTVLGTPAYMAPEQQRGESVDQRADVYAIGGMLWELCTLEKIPPNYSGQRRSILRLSGIDQDLATIVQKALDPAPELRYQNASALAADLKAFKAGTRIAARQYSLFAVLSHWARRHRTFATSISLFIALVILASFEYVTRVAAERDRVATANNELILEHAKLLLQSDPTAAREVLQTYSGTDTTRRTMLEAEARGSHVATFRATPHIQRIHLAERLPDGALLTFGGDGTIAKTTPAGATRVIARHATSQNAFDYISSQQTLVYGCEFGGICLLDVLSERAHQIGPAGEFTPVALAFAPSGKLLASISAQGEISIWRIDSDRLAARFQTGADRAKALKFVDDQLLVTLSNEGVQVLHLGVGGTLAVPPTKLSISEATELSASSELHLLAVSTSTGELVLVDSEQGQITDRRNVCKGLLNRTFIFGESMNVGYSCQGGDIGLFSIKRHSSDVLAHVEGGAALVSGTQDGKQLIAGTNSGNIVIHDFTTGMQAIYRGHTTRVTALRPPSREFASIIAGDASGELRIWPLPDATARVAVTTDNRLFTAQFIPANNTVVAIANSRVLPWSASDGSAGELIGHNPMATRATASGKRPDFVVFGFDDELELWSFSSAAEKRTIRAGHGPVADVEYMPDGNHFVVASRDGTLLEWSFDGAAPRQLASINEPVLFVRVLRSIGSIVFGGASGTLWLWNGGRTNQVGKETASITAVTTSNDSRWLAIGTKQSEVHVHDLTTGRTHNIRAPDYTGEFMAFSADSSILAVATSKKISIILLSTLDGDLSIPTDSAAARTPWRWNNIEVVGQSLAFSRDNKWFAITCDHGGIWFNRRSSDQWIYISTGASRIPLGYFSPDSLRFIATDTAGRALTIDMHATLFEQPTSERNQERRER